MEYVLKALFENEKMNYRSIVDSGIHPNTARRKLDEFIQKGLIREDGRKNWKRGKKLFYSLTDKGREEYLRSVINNLNVALKNVQETTAKMLLHPSQFERWRKISKEAFFGIKITEEMPLDERIRTVKAGVNRIIGPLMESYKNMHELICQLLLPPEIRDSNTFIGFTEKGGLSIIPAVQLRERGFDLT